MKDIVIWLYLVSQDHASITALPTIGCRSENVVNILSKMKNECLFKGTEISSNITVQVERSLKRPFEVLAASTSSTSDFMEKLTQIQSQSSKKSSKNFKKIPTKYQNMITVASSNYKITEVDYTTEGAEFFKCSSILNAQVMINCIFEAENINCSVSSAVVSTLQFGSFLWKDSISPLGFAALVLSSGDFLHSDTLHDGTILVYTTKFEMSETALNKLTKSQVLFPSDVEELTHRIRGIHALSVFFFKKNGFLSQGLKKVVNFCLDNKLILKTRIYMDKKIISKFICVLNL